MRTTIYTSQSDPDETDEWPGCGASADAHTRDLTILDDDDGVQSTYGRDEWVAVTVVNE